MKNDAEEKVSEFYNTDGWKTEGDVTEDAARWEDLRACAREYISKCRLRVLRHIPADGEFMLDMASGPIQYREYLEYSGGYRKRYCVDLSSGALEAAKNRIKDHGVFLCGSFFDVPLEDNFFDCSISLHTIYHIDRDKQEEAVRKLIAVTKPGRPVIIVYSNPRTIVRTLVLPFLFLGRMVRQLRKADNGKAEEPVLYFFAHPLIWWDRFHDAADIKIMPWRSFHSDIQKALIPNNKFGKKMFKTLFSLEERFPAFFARHFQYPMIILRKKN
jgi:SAM-dependent methyltransferase